MQPTIYQICLCQLVIQNFLFKTRITKLIFMQNQNTSMQTLKGFMITNLDRSSSEEKSEWLTARNSFPTRTTDSKSVPASGSGSSTSS